MTSRSKIPELDALLAGKSLIRVPSEQNVPFTSRVRAIVDTEEFQRLSEISQLGMVAKVYPGARHTRFEHALGVYHNTLRFLQQLTKDDRFLSQVNEHQVDILIASSLLHDVGHWPFCHPIEDMGLPGLPPHEAHAARFISAETELGQVLKNEWGIEAHEILDILAPKTKSPQLKLMRSILSGPIDVDKMDYLDRDSLHCGVPYGRNFDRQRLVQSLTLNEAGDGLAITVKGKTAAELMVFARYVMFSEVYWHHAVRCATSMFARGFYELYDTFDLSKLFGCTDHEMVTALMREAQGHPVEQVLNGVFGRKRGLYKRAVEYSHDRSGEAYNRIAGKPYQTVLGIAEKVTSEVNRHYRVNIHSTELLIDAPPPHREVELNIDVYFPKDQSYRPLRQVSPVVDALASSQFDDWVKRVRIFVAPQHEELAKQVDWDKIILEVTA